MEALCWFLFSIYATCVCILCALAIIIMHAFYYSQVYSIKIHYSMSLFCLFSSALPICEWTRQQYNLYTLIPFLGGFEMSSIRHSWIVNVVDDGSLRYIFDTTMYFPFDFVAKKFSIKRIRDFMDEGFFLLKKYDMEFLLKIKSNKLWSQYFYGYGALTCSILPESGHSISK